MHEAKEGEYDFTGSNDVVGFIQMAQAAGLLVVVRAGQLYVHVFPCSLQSIYICTSCVTTGYF